MGAAIQEDIPYKHARVRKTSKALKTLRLFIQDPKALIGVILFGLFVLIAGVCSFDRTLQSGGYTVCAITATFSCTLVWDDKHGTRHILSVYLGCANVLDCWNRFSRPFYTH